MAEALTPVLATAAVVLLIAGIAKLRSPARARWVPVALLELGVGAWCLIAPSTLAAAVLAATYLALAVGALVLARRHVPCGCFGESETPTSPFQALLSALLSLVGITAALTGTHGLAWMLARSPAEVLVLLCGIATAAYGTAVAYTELPRAWTAWSGR